MFVQVVSGVVGCVLCDREEDVVEEEDCLGGSVSIVDTGMKEEEEIE